MSSAGNNGGRPIIRPSRASKPEVLRECTEVGAGVHVRGRVHVRNAGTLRLADGVRFLGGAIPIEIEVREGAVLEIGPNVLLEEGARISVCSHVWIGERCRLAAFATVRDDCTAEGAQPTPITIGEGVTLRERTIVLGGVAIGQGAVLPVGSVVATDVPPASSSNASSVDGAPQPDDAGPALSQSQAPDISVIIPTRNRASLLLETLAALEDQTAPRHRFEVVVVDDGSTDGTAEQIAARQIPLRLRVIKNGGEGVAAARNAGAAAARGRVLLFVDDDVLPMPTLVSAHLAQHNAATPTVVIGLLAPSDGSHQPAWARWEADRLNHHYRAMGRGLRPPAGRRLYSGNFSVDRQLFLDCGGFDTTMPRAEDVDLGYRLEAAGARFVHCPEAAGTHRGLHDFVHWQASAREYGRCDVILARDRDYGQGLPGLFAGFHSRHPLQRLSTTLLVGRAAWLSLAVWAISLVGRAASGMRARTLARWAFSGAYNLLYWRGVHDQLGPALFWQWLNQTAPGRGMVEGTEASG